ASSKRSVIVGPEDSGIAIALSCGQTEDVMNPRRNTIGAMVALGLAMYACGGAHAAKPMQARTPVRGVATQDDDGYEDGYEDAILAVTLERAMSPNAPASLAEATGDAHPVDAAATDEARCLHDDDAHRAQASRPVPADTHDAIVPAV